MSTNKTRGRVLTWLTHVPGVWQALGILLGIAGFLLVVIALPGRVAALEVWKEKTADPVLLFLACSQDAENEGRDPRPCKVILRDVHELLGLAR